jgi:hypothetical protein
LKSAKYVRETTRFFSHFNDLNFSGDKYFLNMVYLAAHMDKINQKSKKLPLHETLHVSSFSSIQFIFISPQTSQYIGQHNEKNYIDGEKVHLQI